MSTSDADDSGPGPTTADKALGDLLPAGWRQRRGAAHASAYLMPGVSLSDLSPAFSVDLGDVCVLMGWLALPRLRIKASFEHRHEGGTRVSLTTSAGVREPAPSSLFITMLEHLAVTRELPRIHGQRLVGTAVRSGAPA